MTFPAIFSLDNLLHIDVIRTLAHDKYLFMADLALEPDPVEPMGEYDGGHSGLFRVSVQCKIGIFRLCGGCLEQTEERNDWNYKGKENDNFFHWHRSSHKGLLFYLPKG